MGWRFSKRVGRGPFRVTAGRRGIGGSVGAGPFRVGRSPSGRGWWTFTLLGTGLSFFRYLRKRRR